MDRVGPYLLGPNDTPENGIYTGDARELAKAIPDESVDLIFTDPPYAKKYLYLYEWLFPWAARVLSPEGFLLVYAGAMHKDKVMALAGEHMDYFMDLISFNNGNKPVLWPCNLILAHKSILTYQPPGSQSKPRFKALTAWVGGGEDKRYHTWGQDESTARYYIDAFSAPESLVVDPFSGGGTTPAVAKLLGRSYLGFEIEPEAAQVGRERVRKTQVPLLAAQPEQLAF